jgi:hypothetical protein
LADVMLNVLHLLGRDDIKEFGDNESVFDLSG